MITFRQALDLKVGDCIYQAIGWKDNRPTAWAEYQVTAVHRNSIDIVSTETKWGRHCRLFQSDFPLVYFKLTGE